MGSAVVQRRFLIRDAGWSALTALFTPLQAALAAPSLLFIGTLTVMLFRPPDLEFFYLDRIALVLLAVLVLLRATITRQSLRPRSTLVLPMAALLGLVAADLLLHSFDASLWSVAVAKFGAPYALFYLAGLVFDDETSIERLEKFAWAVLAYLTFIDIAFLAGWNFLIFPKFILESSLGINADRARGPFLNAVASGVSLNFLGLVALDSYGRGRLRGLWALLLLGSLPVAILATRTRGVWLSFAASLLLLMLSSSSKRIRNVCFAMLAAGVVGVLLLVVSSGELGNGMNDRLNDRHTVEFRMEAYRAGWGMLLERPLTGWGARGARVELEGRIEGYPGELTVAHNTYLEVLLEHGVIGFVLYAWIVVGLFKLGRTDELDANRRPTSESFLQLPCRPLWFLLLGVYVVNGIFVVMNYQFVNALLFTWAGILAQRQRNLSEAETGVFHP